MAPRPGCGGCLLRVPAWPGSGKTSATGFCIWFLKRLEVPRPIPEDVVPKGCANRRAIPGKP